MNVAYRAKALVTRDGAYRAADAAFMPLERRELMQNRALARIPSLPGRRGGTHTVTEWAYTVGVFQALAHTIVGEQDQLDVLDVGCGTGRLSIAATPLLGEHGSYVGIDISEHDIALCRKYHDDPRMKFIHLTHSNRAYATEQEAQFEPYPLPDESTDLATALSVWTHLNEADATFYLAEVARVLRPGGHAIITFFVLDEEYKAFLAGPIESPSPYSFRDPAKYRYDVPVDGSDAWFCPEWVSAPEWAIGVTSEGIARLTAASGLEVVQQHRGHWKKKPGLFFQDTLVFRKPG